MKHRLRLRLRPSYFCSLPLRFGLGRQVPDQLTAGMRVAPGRVVLDSYTLERANSVPGDDRPFVRLWLEEPATRVTITWDKR